MSDNDNEQLEAIIPDEELDLDLELDNDDTEDVITLKREDYEKLTKRAKAVPSLLARTRKAEAKNKAPQINKTEVNNDSLKDEMWTIADYIRDGYDREDVDFIMRNGGRDALKDSNSYVSIALKQKMEQRKAENATLQNGGGSQLSEFERKYTPEQLENMSSAELAKILPRA